MTNRSRTILALALIVVLQACSPNAMADTKPTQRDKASAEYKRCINTVKRVASKDDDVVGMIVRCREYALKQQR